MGTRSVVKRKKTGWAIVLGLVVASLSGCATNGLYVDPIDVAVPLVSMAVRSNSKEGGRLTAHLSDGRVLEGTWAKVSDSRPASALSIRTPDGEITVATLAAPDLPFAAAHLQAEGARMVCAVAGDAVVGYTSQCAESSGARWVGSPWLHNLAAGYTTFHGDLTVWLFEKH